MGGGAQTCRQEVRRLWTLTLPPPPPPGALVLVDGGPGSTTEGLFQSNQLLRPESSQAQVQRAQAVAAKARALAM